MPKVSGLMLYEVSGGSRVWETVKVLFTSGYPAPDFREARGDPDVRS